MAYNFEKLEALLKEKGVNKGEIEEIITPLKNMARQRRYGLVWEEPGETSYDKDQAEKALEKAFAFLKEVPERRIEKTPEKPMNLLIEGDNYHSLKALQYTHKGLVDVIYIDPPYNTGNKDFVYNDRYVDSEDSWRHSSWLSFMNKRLKLARELMTEDGVIFISIGDDELAQLKLMCDQLFGEFNHVGTLPRIAKKGSNKGNHFRPTKDYVLVYCKNLKKLSSFYLKIEQNVKEYKLIEDFGLNAGKKYKKGHSLFQASLDSRPNQRYYIEAPDGTLIIPPGESHPEEKSDGAYVLPKDNSDKCYRWSRQSYQKHKKDGIIFFAKSKNSPLIDSEGNHTDWNVYEKKYFDNTKQLTTLPDDVVYEFLNTQGTIDLKNMGLNFSFSKPVGLIKYLITILQKRSDILVLDFFAGSGTTGQAVMELNKEDGGNRQFILCTNNENNIAEEVTYKRNKHVIEGYTTPKGKVVEGIPNNLSYYKVDLLEDSGDSDENRLQGILHAVDLITIKEQSYEREEKETFTVLRKKEKVVYVVTDFFSLIDEDMDDIVADLLKEAEAEKVLYTNYTEYAQEQTRYRGEDMPEELLGVLK